MEIREIIFYIVLIVIIFLPFIHKFVNNILRKKNKESNINFDEFDNIDKIKQQELKEKLEMEYETEVLDKVYRDSYYNSLKEAVKEEHDYIPDEYFRTENNFSVIDAIVDAHKNVKKAKEDIYNFSVLDAVEVEEDYVVEGNPINALRENGYTFDINLFKKWSRQIFGCIKSGSEEQLKIVKNFMSEELYDKLEYQMKQFAKDGLEFVTEDLLIEKCYLYDYSKSVSKEEIKILISAQMKEYIIRKSNNEILKGSKNKVYKKNIIMSFVKKNAEDIEGIIRNCPNCGAEVSRTEFGKCKYCNTIIFPIRYNWTLTKFETL